MTESEAVVDKCYNNKFLKQVILRADFTSPVFELAERLTPDLSKLILKEFPILDRRKIIAHEMKISPEGMEQSQSKVMYQWHFFGKEREKKLSILESALVLSYSKYNRYENLQNDFFQSYEAVTNFYEMIQIRRLGLRYINEFNIEDGEDPFEWSNYITEDLLSMLSYKVGGILPSRIMSKIETRFDDFTLNFSFGMPNPDFPSPIKQKVFVLDLDAYYEGALEVNELSEMVNSFHKEIQCQFELSITDKMREEVLVVER